MLILRICGHLILCLWKQRLEASSRIFDVDVLCVQRGVMIISWRVSDRGLTGD